MINSRELLSDVFLCILHIAKTTQQKIHKNTLVKILSFSIFIQVQNRGWGTCPRAVELMLHSHDVCFGSGFKHSKFYHVKLRIYKTLYHTSQKTHFHISLLASSPYCLTFQEIDAQVESSVFNKNHQNPCACNKILVNSL